MSNSCKEYNTIVAYITASSTQFSYISCSVVWLFGMILHCQSLSVLLLHLHNKCSPMKQAWDKWSLSTPNWPHSPPCHDIPQLITLTTMPWYTPTDHTHHHAVIYPNWPHSPPCHDILHLTTLSTMPWYTLLTTLTTMPWYTPSHQTHHHAMIYPYWPQSPPCHDIPIATIIFHALH